MSHRLPPDPDLEDLFDEDPGLEPYANLLRASRLNEPPLDPAFRSSLRRHLIEQAWARSERRPSLFASLFRGPGLAWAGASMAAVLLAIVVLQLVNSAPPSSTTTYLSAYPTGSVQPDQPIVLTFSQPMDHQAVQSAIHIEPATAVTYTWQSNQLTIVPVANSLAPNTQYHVTIASSATTAAGKPIGQPVAVAFNTQAAPSPSPIPNATPTPALGLAGERLLRVDVAAQVAWSPDGATLFYLGANGELASIGADGRGPRQLVADSVRAASLSPSGLQVAYLRNGTVALIGVDGGGAQVLAQADAVAVAWAESRVVYAVVSEPSRPASPAVSPAPVSSPSPPVSSPSPSPTPPPAPTASPGPSPASTPSPGATPAATTAQSLTVRGPASNFSFAPDGRHLLYTSGGATLLTDGLTATPWTTPAVAPVRWSPDSSTVAFVQAGAVFIAAPDGGRRRQLATLALLGLGSATAAEVNWSSTDQLLVGAAAGLATIRSDGTGATAVRSLEYTQPSWAPAASRFAFLRRGDLWIADLAGTIGAGNALADAEKVVETFMAARQAGDTARATALLDAAGRQAFASGGPSLIVSGEPHLRRSYTVSEQLLPGTDAGVQFVVRLVLARGTTELFTYDETLTLQRSASATLMVHAAGAGPRVALGHGPSILSAAVRGPLLVVTFDSDLAPETVAAAVTVGDPKGAPIAVKVTYADRSLTVALPPLPPVRGYRLVIATSLQDVDHQPLAHAYEFDFVAAAPAPTPSPAASPTPSPTPSPTSGG